MPHQRVAHAVIAQAMDEAEGGNKAAEAFLLDDTHLPDLAFWAAVLGLPVDVIRFQFQDPDHAY